MNVRLALFAVILTAVAVLIVVQSILLDADKTRDDLQMISIVLSAVICLLVLAYPMRHPSLMAPPRLMAGLTLLLFPVFSLTYTVVPDLSKWYFQFYPSANFKHKLALVNFYTTLSLPIFLVGYALGEQTRLRAPVLSHTRNSVFLTVLVAVLVIGILGMLSYSLSLGGISVILENMGNMSERRLWHDRGNRLFFYIGMVLLTAPTVLSLSVFVSVRSLWGLVVIALILFVGATVLLLTQASREKAVLPLILFVIAVFLLTQRSASVDMKRRGYALLLVLVGFAVLLFAVQTMVRWSTTEGSQANGLRMFSDFNRLDVSIVIFSHYFDPELGKDPLLGLPMLSYFNQFLVRLMDMEPIMNTSMILHDFIFDGDPKAGNPGAPFVGELYLNFRSYAFFVFLPIGFFFARSYTALANSNYEFWRVLFYSTHAYFFFAKIFTYIGFSESVLIMLLVYVPLLGWQFLYRIRLGSFDPTQVEQASHLRPEEQR